MSDPYAEQFRDCASDVVALAEAYLQAQSGDRAQVMIGMANFDLIMRHADAEGCLRVAAPLLANAWQYMSEARAAAEGITAEEALSRFLGKFRAGLGRLLFL